MKVSLGEKPSLESLRTIKSTPVTLSQEGLVKAERLRPEMPFPLVLRPAVDGVRVVAWAGANRTFVSSRLIDYGALLFRGFDVKSAEALQEMINAVSGEPFEYRERSSPRHVVSGRIYTSTDYPADQSIFLHNENSYAQVWPLKIFFCCVKPAEQGGQTPLADVRRVLSRIDPDVRERFRRKRVMYLRNLGPSLGLSWQTAFQTTDRSAVEDYCRSAGYEFQWRSGDRLRTRRVAQAIATHPNTKAEVWFNHAAFFNVSTLRPELRETLLSQFREEDLPHNTYYGDGSPIEPSVLNEIREAYQKETVSFSWRRGDVLILDNMLMAHGRTPYTGSRQVLVGMAEPVSESR